MNATQVNQNFSALYAAIVARDSVTPSKDNTTAQKRLIASEKSIKHGMIKINNEAMQAIIAKQSEIKKASDNFIAVKVNVKIVSTLSAIGAKLVSELDSYTATIVANALHNDGVIFAKSALVCLSKDITYNELEAVQVIKARMRVAASTADTQRSSTRQMLNALELAVIHKRVKSDNIELTVKGHEVFSALFA
jgi:hypothetical protein